MPAFRSNQQLSLFEPSPAPHPARGAATTKGARTQGAQRSAAIAVQPELPLGPLPTGYDPAMRAALERRLAIAMGGPLTVTITDNRRTMISVRRRDGLRHVRLHHMFLDAPLDVIEAVGRYLARGDRVASKHVDQYIAANQTRIRAGQPSAPTRLEPRGRVYDLAEIQRSLSERYFDGKVQLDITWGRAATNQRRRRARRTIRMGTYFIEEKLIRIHPALDQAFVPRYFVEWVVYHEMLHHVVPMPVLGGRKVYHSPEFRARERLYEDYERAREWEQRNLRRLITSRNSLHA